LTKKIDFYINNAPNVNPMTDFYCFP